MKPVEGTVNVDKKSVRRRKPPTELKFTEESKRNLQERLQSEEGQRCLDEFAKLIAEWAAKATPTELLEALGTREGQALLKELWPDIVNAYFKALCPPPRKQTKRAAAGDIPPASVSNGRQPGVRKA